MSGKRIKRSLPKNVELKFFEMYSGNIKLSDFEQWVYSDEKLQSTLSKEDYLDLASFDFHQDAAKYELSKKLAEEFVNIEKFERWKVLKILKQCLKLDDKLPDLIEQLDRLCSNGYQFLFRVGYIFHMEGEHPLYLSSGYPHRPGSVDKWQNSSHEIREKIIAQHYPNLVEDVQLIISWINCDKIKFLGPDEEFGRFQYEDNTTVEDRKYNRVTREQKSEVKDIDKNTKRSVLEKLWDMFSI